ncbi:MULTISPECIES: signal recognition particle [unclassified Beijerinckia]|uniref:signal recognition particle n=1 Tax=unclassified Beijerinckia TaxID=2638183 RepID=UPI001114A624|nr:MULTISPECIES: signal recognition particle [unclassified Beijerinckia]
MKPLLATCLCGLLCGTAFAWDEAERSTLARSLATLLASETPCDLAYNQEAIRRFIDKQVPANDMQFPTELTNSLFFRNEELKDMSTSQKTAHCHQIERIAKSYSFVR